jgi:hypothetical protein
MGFFIIIGIIFVLWFAYFTAPVIERFYLNYISGLFKNKNKQEDSKEEN